MRLRVSLLGSFRVALDGIDVTEFFHTKKERALLAYLSQEGQQVHRRETIAELFWPDRPEGYARTNLRQALLGIRKAISGDELTNPFLRVTDDTAQLNPHAVWLDTNTFAQLLSTVQHHLHPHLHTCQECIKNLEEAVELYRGDFIEDLPLADATNFQEWTMYQREQYFRRMLSALHYLSEIYQKRGQFDQAHVHAWRYVSLAPLEETAHRQLMRLLSLSGRRAAAIEQYQTCKAFLARELGIEPASETKRMFEQIKNGLPLDEIDTGSLAGPSRLPKQTRQSSRGTGPLYDPITQIPTRTLFFDRLQHAITRMDRDQRIAAVCVLSVSFPRHHDISGELKNQVEQNLVRRLIGAVRKGDTVARLQDDEFALILEAITDPKVVQPIAQNIARTASDPIQVQGQRIEVKVILGTSMYPRDGMDANALIDHAEMAMRTARLQQASFFFTPPEETK